MASPIPPSTHAIDPVIPSKNGTEGRKLVVDLSKEMPVPPELQAAREELAIWQQVLNVMGDARIPAREHEAAEKILSRVLVQVDAAQARVNALLPADGSLGEPGPLSTDAPKPTAPPA